MQNKCEVKNPLFHSVVVVYALTDPVTFVLGCEWRLNAVPACCYRGQQQWAGRGAVALSANMSALFAVGTLSAAMGCGCTRTCTKVATATSVASAARASRAAQTCGAISCSTRASRSSLVRFAATSSATHASCDGTWRRTMPGPRHQISCECGVAVNLLAFTNACMISSGPIYKHLSLHSRFAMYAVFVFLICKAVYNL